MLEKGSKEGVEETVEKAVKLKPYSKGRPSYAKGQVDEVWGKAVDEGGP